MALGLGGLAAFIPLLHIRQGEHPITQKDEAHRIQTLCRESQELDSADIDPLLDPLKDLLPVPIDGIGVKANHSGYQSFPRQCRRCSQMLLDRSEA